MVNALKYTRGNNPNSIKTRFHKGISQSSYWWKSNKAEEIKKKISEGQKKHWQQINQLNGSFKKEYICKECGKSFIRYKKIPKEIVRGKQINYYSFCSRKCFAAYQSRLCSKWDKILTKEILEDLYINKKNSANEIAKKFKCVGNTVLKLIKKYNIPKRPFNESVKLGVNKNIEKFKEATKGSKNPMFGKISYPKARFIPELGHSIRSEWEKVIAYELKKADIPYKYEGITFKINHGNNTYTPDFIIKDIAIEVKGALFDKNKEKLILFKKECPYKLWIVCGEKNRYDFSFADKVFKIFNEYKKTQNDNEIQRLINEIRKNL